MSSFFFLTLIGMTYSENIDVATRQLIRLIPVVFTPIIFLYDIDFYKKYSRAIFLGLITGCFIAMLICWGNVAIEMIINNEPLSYFFRFRHVNHQLTEVIDIHAGYLSLFVITSIAIITKHYRSLNSSLKPYGILLILLFSLFLISLLARTLLFFYVLSVFLYIIYKKAWKVIIPLVIIGTTFFIVVVNIDDEYEYLRKKLFYQIPLFGEDSQQDIRFKRLGATKMMFLENPLMGVGTADSKEFRRKHYLNIGDKKGYERSFNAHNQFFEYLDEFGFFGGLFYLLFFGLAIKISLKRRDYLFLYITVLFFVANITESMLQRTHGVIYFSIMFSLFFSNEFKLKKDKIN
jgi:O-antigen ligase